MLAAMPCKTPINSGRETYCGIGKRKTKHACIVEADESTRIRLEAVPHRCHEDRIPESGRMQSAGLIPWNVTAICETFKTSC